MHFLCLHGMGTNGQVLETSFAALQYELDQSHTYEFPEGCVSTSISADIKAYYPATDEYFQYYDANSALSVALALAQLEKYIEIEGPFDGVLGFSQGASLAAAYLVHLSRDFPSRPLPFRCAVFFCGGPPFDPQAVEQNELRLMDAEETGPILELPTAHMWARNDKVWPGGGEMLSELCEETERNIYVHNEGHSIPGPRAKEALQGCVRAIRRTIARTEMMQ